MFFRVRKSTLFLVSLSDFFRYLQSISGKPLGRSFYSNSEVSLPLFAANFQKPGELQRLHPPPMLENKNRPRSATPPSTFGKPKIRHGCKQNPAIGAHHAQPSKTIEIYNFRVQSGQKWSSPGKSGVD